MSSHLILFLSTFFVRLLLKLGTDASEKLLGLPLLISMAFLVQMVLSFGCPPSTVEMGVFGSLIKQSLEKGYPSLLMSNKYSKCFCSQNTATLV